MESAGVDQQVKVPMLNTVYPRDAPGAAPYVGKDHANFVYMLTEG